MWLLLWESEVSVDGSLKTGFCVYSLEKRTDRLEKCVQSIVKNFYINFYISVRERDVQKLSVWVQALMDHTCSVTDEEKLRTDGRYVLLLSAQHTHEHTCCTTYILFRYSSNSNISCIIVLSYCSEEERNWKKPSHKKQKLDMRPTFIHLHDFFHIILGHFDLAHDEIMSDPKIITNNLQQQTRKINIMVDGSAAKIPSFVLNYQKKYSYHLKYYWRYALGLYWFIINRVIGMFIDCVILQCSICLYHSHICGVIVNL